jgi:hypothetical protein
VLQQLRDKLRELVDCELTAPHTHTRGNAHSRGGGRFHATVKRRASTLELGGVSYGLGPKQYWVVWHGQNLIGLALSLYLAYFLGIYVGVALERFHDDLVWEAWYIVLGILPAVVSPLVVGPYVTTHYLLVQSLGPLDLKVFTHVVVCRRRYKDPRPRPGGGGGRGYARE